MLPKGLFYLLLKENNENPAKVSKEMRVARDENGKFCFAPEERRTTKEKAGHFSRLAATERQQKSPGEKLVKNAEASGEEDLQAWEKGRQLRELQTVMYQAVDQGIVVEFNGHDI